MKKFFLLFAVYLWVISLKAQTNTVLYEYAQTKAPIGLSKYKFGTLLKDFIVKEKGIIDTNSVFNIKITILKPALGFDKVVLEFWKDEQENYDAKILHGMFISFTNAKALKEFTKIYGEKTTENRWDFETPGKSCCGIQIYIIDDKTLRLNMFDECF